MADLRSAAEAFIQDDPALCAEIARVLTERATSTMGLTRRQRELYEFLKTTIAATGTAPSISEMAAHFGVAGRSNIHGIVVALEERGLIRRFPNRARAIEIIGAV